LHILSVNSGNRGYTYPYSIEDGGIAIYTGILSSGSNSYSLISCHYKIPSLDTCVSTLNLLGVANDNALFSAPSNSMRFA
jgi:hypothetical protein